MGVLDLSQSTKDIRLAELLGALSHALDMTEGQPLGHCVRCCWIGLQMAEALGLSEQETADLYYVLLLKDLGCSSNAARICQLYLTDDLSFKRDFKFIDGSLPQAMRFVIGHTGLSSSLAERFRAVVNIFQNGGDISRELIETRCQRGANIARQMRFSDIVADGIQNLDEHWNGGGKPLGLSGTDIPLYARIALMTQVIDVFHQSEGVQAARAEIMRRRGTWFDPALVDLFLNLSADASFWAPLSSSDLEQRVLALAPGQCLTKVDGPYLDDIATAFAQVIDSKSPFTSGHSERVTVYSDMIAERIGLGGSDRVWLKRAALLHDIGKLGVSNAILDKPGKLDEAEWEQMKLHTVHSEAILQRLTAFADLAPVAAAHHERLDGKGYPRGLTAKAISPETRIITVADIFDALTAERPYRAAMPVSKAFAIMDDMVGTALDPKPYAAIKDAFRSVDGLIN